MSWEDWIMRNDENGPITNYDFILDLAVQHYGLSKRNRKQELIDMRHCLIKWWKKNKTKFKKYNSLTAVGRSMNLTHCTVLHYVKHRKKSHDYERNTICIYDFLTS
jgi:hypothetical protein